MMKTPMQTCPEPGRRMRREAEQRANPQPAVEPGKINPADRPPLAFETPNEVAATRDWLSHIAAGRITVR